MPGALSSKSLLLFVVVIKLSSIRISPVLKLFAVISPVLLISLTVNVPPTVGLPVTCTSLFGTIILPVPFALNSKSALEVVVVIKLSSTSISSNCAEPLMSKFCVAVKLPGLLYYQFDCNHPRV